MSSSSVEQVAEILANAILRANEKKPLTSRRYGAKLRTTKNKPVKNMANDLVQQIIDLEKQSMNDLRSTYEKLYFEKPKMNSKSQLIRQIAYRLQELEYGFLSEQHDKKAQNIADAVEKGRGFANQKYFKPTKGTRLRRTYGGVDHEVETTENGFVYGGLQYKSLSAIARKITGTRWNGLRFFGVCK
jgi:hypothetical protein